MTLSEFFAQMAVSLPQRVLVSLGMGFISYKGFDTLVSNLTTAVISHYDNLPTDLYQILSFAGFTDGIGILLGAHSARAALFSVEVLGKIK